MSDEKQPSPEEIKAAFRQGVGTHGADPDEQRLPMGTEHIVSADVQRLLAAYMRLVQHAADSGSTERIDIIMVGVPTSVGDEMRVAIQKGLASAFDMNVIAAPPPTYRAPNERLEDMRGS